MQLDTTVRPTRSDRADLWTVLVVGAVVAAATIGFAVVRLAGILPNSAVEVLVPFVDTPASVPIGSDGALVPVAIDQGILTVSNLSGFVIASLALAVLIDALMVLTIVACLGLLCRNLMRGRAFSRTNRRLVITTAVAIVVGTALGGLFQTIGVNGAFAAVGYNGYDSVVGTASLAPYFVATALAAVALAFKAGERLQREAEGLV